MNELVLRNENAVRVPVYRWDVNAVSYLSKREHVCVEVWVSTMNVMACVRALKEQVGTDWGWAKVSSLLRRGRVQKVIKERLREKSMSAGATKDSWLSQGMEYQRDGG